MRFQGIDGEVEWARGPWFEGERVFRWPSGHLRAYWATVREVNIEDGLLRLQWDGGVEEWVNPTHEVLRRVDCGECGGCIRCDGLRWLELEEIELLRDPLAPARGIIMALPLAVAVWVLLLGAVVALVRLW